MAWPADPEEHAKRVAALGLGGNVGDVPAVMAQALRALDAADDVAVTAVSRLYRTPPWGPVDQPWFFNCCALIETRLAARDLLALCLDVEAGLKRRRNAPGETRWGPRRIDIDVLLYGEDAIDLPELTVPHPRMTERGFVLVPLAEIAPTLQIKGVSVADWAMRSDRSGIEVMPGGRDWWRD
jgi:2-amino-4-hydroxy-6-hydroxymethyldihydropteridine diphosphokinase